MIAIKNASNLAEDYAEVMVSVTGSFSLSDMLIVNSVLQERFKDFALSTELRTYAPKLAHLYLRAKTSEEKLLQLLTQTGKIPLNEQKLLLFNRENKSFAILEKEQNNEKVTTPEQSTTVH